MKKRILKIFSMVLGSVLAICSMFFCVMTPAYATVSYVDYSAIEKVRNTYNSATCSPEMLVEEYYKRINEGLIQSAFMLYDQDLFDYVSPMLENREAKDAHEGIYNVRKANLEDVTIMNISNGDVTAFVTCNMIVFNSDKYYSNGTNYFVFYFKHYQRGLYITNIEIPSYSIIKEYTSEVAATEYQLKRNSFLYRGVYGVLANDSPQYVDSVANPYRVRVLVNGKVEKVDFTTYMKRCAAVEFNSGLSCLDGYITAAMAAKMFAIQKVLTAGAGANYDINAGGDQGYSSSKQITTDALNAVKMVNNYFLLDKYGAVFPTFYRTTVSDYKKYCVKNGGILPQIEASDLAQQHGWKYALEYYYTRKEKTDYYNSRMNYGGLIITTAHVHDWSGGVECPYCGAEVE